MHSDHMPLLLDTSYFEKSMSRQPKGECKFEAYWLQEDTVKEIVKSSWLRAQTLGVGPTLADRTKAVKGDLVQWDAEVLKGPKKRVNKLKKKLEKLRCGQLNCETRKEMKEVHTIIENPLDQEELHWVRHGRANWLLHGDRNTSFSIEWPRHKRKGIA